MPKCVQCRNYSHFHTQSTKGIDYSPQDLPGEKIVLAGKVEQTQFMKLPLQQKDLQCLSEKNLYMKKNPRALYHGIILAEEKVGCVCV